jgi:hypothetical protein
MPIDDDYVAWMRFAHRTDNQQPYLQICDSDAEGAFKVYRHPLPGAAPAEEWEYRPTWGCLLHGKAYATITDLECDAELKGWTGYQMQRRTPAGEWQMIK